MGFPNGDGLSCRCSSHLETESPLKSIRVPTRLDGANNGLPDRKNKSRVRIGLLRSPEAGFQYAQELLPLNASEYELKRNGPLNKLHNNRIAAQLELKTSFPIRGPFSNSFGQSHRRPLESGRLFFLESTASPSRRPRSSIAGSKSLNSSSAHLYPQDPKGPWTRWVSRYPRAPKKVLGILALCVRVSILASFSYFAAYSSRIARQIFATRSRFGAVFRESRL